jgi:aminopeptidase N/puromycin-sensitive aminopeptidase
MRRAIVAAALLLSAIPAFARLPKSVVPSHYVLTITPDLANETFVGDETIDVDVKEAVGAIVLNAVALDLTNVTINGHPATVTVDAPAQTVTLRPEGTVAAGKATIRDHFSGKLDKTLRGLYLSRTPKRKYAVTQFESTDARRAFPSFDEPAYKAVFDITLVADDGDTAISNGPIAEDTPAGNGKHAIRFAPTKKISSYLVAMLVGDFRCIEGGVDGIPIRVCSTPGMENLCHFSLTAAEATVKFYDGYFGIKYPFGKLDLIGIPDFEAGAMENAGAITFRETALLLDDKTASLERQKGVASTVAHEIAHQWFGDLVTMAWWDDIWLNEGFATFMTAKPLEAWHPEWRTDLDVVGSTNGSLTADAQRATRAIRTRAETPEEINQLFDGIAYGKTAAVLRMVETWLGPDVFRDGIRAYLTKYSWSNAAAEDFWGTMAESSKQPVDAVMKSFVDQAGAPLLRVSESCVDGERRVNIEQQRLTLATQKLSESWTLPICPHGEPCRIVSPASQILTMKGPMKGCDAPLFLSRDGAGYFAVDYAAGERGKLRANLRELTPAERLSLRGNDWLLTRTLHENAGEYLALLREMPRPAERPMVAAVADSLQFFEQRLVSDTDRAAWEQYVGAAMQGYAPLTWDTPPSETAEQRIARAEVLWTMGYSARDPKVIAGASAVAEQYMKDSTSVDAVIADRALPLAVIHGDEALYQRIQQRLESATTPEMHNRYLGLLTDFRDPKLIARTLDYIFSDKTRTQDLPRMLGSMMANPVARDATWAAIKAHWSEIETKVPTAIGGVAGAAGVFCDAASKRDVEAFFTAHPPRGGDRGLRRGLEAIDTCVAFRAAQQSSFDSGLAP